MAQAQPTWCDCLCTCLCKNYVKLVSLILLILGLAALVAMCFVFASMYKTLDDDDIQEALQEFAGASKVKWLGLSASLFMIVAGAIGFRFADTRSRCQGGAFAAFMFIAIVLQLVGLIILLTSAGSAAAKRKAYTSLADRYGTDDPVQGKPMWGCGELNFGGEEKGKAEPWEDFYCRGRPAKPTCKEGWVAKQIEEYCSAKASNDAAVVELSEKNFKEGCSKCHLDWWAEIEESLKSGSEKRPPNWYHAKWGEPEGQVYCRCMGRVQDSLSRHKKEAKWCMIAFGAIQLGLLAATIWLIIWGPLPQARANDGARGELELNLGNLGYVPGSVPVNAAPDFVEVQCPPGMGPDMPVEVTTVDGRKITVKVPHGVAPGQMFKVRV